jgi:hypothetical protein
MANAQEERAWLETVSREDDTTGNDEEGVLLYYKFVEIGDPNEIKTWLFDLSTSLGLLGRIRVAPDGINVTVGISMDVFELHIFFGQLYIPRQDPLSHPDVCYLLS